MNTASGPSEHYPLSPMQLGMLFHHLTAPAGAGVDVEQIVGTLEEQVDAASLREAWQAAASRHDALRTSIVWEGVPEPRQRVAQRVEIPWEVRALRGTGGAGAEAQLAEFLRADRARGFRLDQPPLMRVTVFAGPGAGATLVWTFHHVALDGRSFAVVLRDVFACYEAIRARREPPAREPGPAYRDFIEWLGSRSARPGDNEEFWRARLAGFTEPTPIAGPGEKEPVGEDHGERRASLEAPTTQRLGAFAREIGVTLNTLVQGAWALVLARHAGTDEAVFGAARACRRSTIDGADRVVGVFMNTLPVRARLDPRRTVADFLRALREDDRAVWSHEHAPLMDVQGWSDAPRGSRLFESIIIFDRETLDQTLRALEGAGAWSGRTFRLHERTGYPLALYGAVDDGLRFTLAHQRTRVGDDAAERLLRRFVRVLERLPAQAHLPLASVTVLTPEEQRTIVHDWNATEAPALPEPTIHERIAAQTARTPDAAALASAGRELTYAELDARANRVAHHLRGLGVGPGTRVGVCTARGLDMVVGVLAVLKAGGAYVPLDPAFPRDRIEFMLRDARVPVLLTQDGIDAPTTGARVVRLDRDADAIAREPSTPPPAAPGPADLAYVIYTSGSTGRPKGVMVEHRNVLNFFAAMDARIPSPPGGGAPGVWLAVTSLSFDISVLELLWTLTRGYKVVLHAELAPGPPAGASDAPRLSRPIGFGLFYFASDEGSRPGEKYRLLLEGARFADEHAFHAVWTPERHFHAFGGLYPNPAVTGAAIAGVTKRVRIRAGSVVLPLHHPARVAEEWALVDNLSGGRADVSFASGWQPVDFVLRPESYATRHALMYEGIEVVRRLWRGEPVAFPDANGRPTDVRTLPRPIQKELPVWITTAGDPETWRSAGRIGANILTHLLGQTVEEIGRKVSLYRQARADAGHDPDTGRVSIMLHTFVGDDDERVKETVREPMIAYLGSSLSLVKNVASAWSAFKRRADGSAAAADVDLKALTPRELRELLEFSFERYFETSGLFGTPRSCMKLVAALADQGVDEIACLIDFGVDAGTVLAHLDHLDRLRSLAAGSARGGPASGPEDGSIGGLIRAHRVTHVQCTPAMARMILSDPGARGALRDLAVLLVGGEALPHDLARELRAATGARVFNMYGPTETTVWSAMHAVDPDAERANAPTPIGRPIANTRLYVLDAGLRPVPVGVPGELFIGGAGVVRGYLDRPELTAERFIPDPFRPGERVYRTGDLARWRADGVAEFLGRTDFQVKVRGHRIELGEVEAALAAIPGVHESVVIAREDAPGDQRLVAYVVARAGTPVNPGEVRESLRRVLPEYMVPSNVVILGALPLTPNKKVDRKALPRPDAPEAPAAITPPTNDAERTITMIWQEVLGLSRVGITDNFFDLGGHSLLAVKAHRRLTESFGRELAITDLFRFPTVQALAAYLTRGDGPSGADLGGVRAQTRRAKMSQAAQRRRARSAAGDADEPA